MLFLQNPAHEYPRSYTGNCAVLPVAHSARLGLRVAGDKLHRIEVDASVLTFALEVGASVLTFALDSEESGGFGRSADAFQFALDSKGAFGGPADASARGSR